MITSVNIGERVRVGRSWWTVIATFAGGQIEVCCTVPTRTGPAVETRRIGVVEVRERRT